jgi:hypothetical protein
MADEEKNTEDEMMPEDTSSGDVADMGGTDMGDAELDMPEEQPQRPSRVSKIFASIPPIPEYPIAKPVETEQDEDDSMEPERTALTTSWISAKRTWTIWSAWMMSSGICRRMSV